MKKFVLALPVILFPYWILFAMFFMSSDIFLEQEGSFLFLAVIFGLGALTALSFVFSVIITGLGVAKKWEARELARLNMTIKLLQIPAYLLIFIFGAIFALTIFTITLTLILIVYDAIAIFLSGLIGVSATVRAKAQGYLPGQLNVFFGLFQFIYCIDIIAAIILFVKTKPKPLRA